jgi:diaminopimelate decarboxylase
MTMNAPHHSLSWWQRPDLSYQHGYLEFAEHRVVDLAAQCGTPSFIYSARRIQHNLLRVHAALDEAGFGGRHSICYAMKANRFAPLLTYMKQTGLCGIDACSPNEVIHAVSCGFRPEEISFTATSLSQSDLDTLARHRGLIMNCDSLHSIREWGSRRPGSTIGLRINPGLGVSRSDNDKLQYAGAVTTKFGIYREQFQEALDLAAAHDLQVVRIHFHTGCGYLDAQLPAWDQVIRSCLWFVDHAPDVHTVNIGGGLGVPHVASDRRLDLHAWAAVIARHFSQRNLHLVVEPGDYIVKDAGLLLLGKTYLEHKRDTLFMGVDAGFNIAPEPAHYQLPFHAVPLYWGGEPLVSVQVAGNINEALDVWQADADLPDMTDQQYLALINAGGYSSSMASNHCMRGEFREFLLL